MAKPSRETAYAALWTLLLTVPAPAGSVWGERKRGVKQWDQVPPGSQPAMFLQQGPQRASRRREQGLTTWEWYAEAMVYFRYDTIGTDADWLFTNTLIDSLDTVIQGSRGERQTLGGVIYDCYIDGECGLYDAIDDPNQGVVLIPIVMLSGI